jgi:glyoxylase-like metal-dependent hydrolase (beta-lactamase superfamily II)
LKYKVLYIFRSNKKSFNNNPLQKLSEPLNKRRQKIMKRIFFVFMAAFTLIFFSGCSDDDSDNSTVASTSTGTSEKTAAFADSTPEGFQNTVQTVQIDENVTLHAFIASKAENGNATHIIETSDNLVLIDAQFVEKNAQEFRKYADSLTKPIARLIISHSHPDHWSGLENFKDVEVYAFQETSEKMTQNGASVIPQSVLTEGTFELDGVTFKVEKRRDAEADVQAVISLPNHHVIALSDLLYNEIHPFTALNQFDNWINLLNDYKAGKYDFYLTGHGEPGDVTILDNMVQYLTDSSTLVKQPEMTASEFMTQLQEKYPKWEGRLLAFSAGRLFPDNSGTSEETPL